MPAITVAMPVYNDADYVREAVDSILAQTFTDFTLLIVDDGSTDATPAILDSLADPRIRILRHERNLGRSAARNTALAAADSRYLAWMDADDISLPRRLERQAAFLDAHPDLSACGTGLRLFHQGRGQYRFSADPDMVAASMIFHTAMGFATTMFRLTDIRATGLAFDRSFRRAEDLLFLIELLLRHRLRGANLPAALYRWRWFGSHDNNADHRRCMLESVLPLLGIEASETEKDIHAGLGCGQRAELFRRHGTRAVFGWLDRLCAHCRERALPWSSHLPLVAHEYAERLIACAPNPLAALAAYRRTALARSHPARLLYGRGLARLGKRLLGR